MMIIRIICHHHQINSQIIKGSRFIHLYQKFHPCYQSSAV